MTNSPLPSSAELREWMRDEIKKLKADNQKLRDEIAALKCDLLRGYPGYD